MSVALLATLLLAAAPAPVPTLIDGRSPEMLQKQIVEMGYSITPFVVTGSSATATMTIAADRELTIVLGGCTRGAACSYAVLVGAYTDVTRPPATWVAAANSDYDLIKVWVRDDGALTFSDGGPVDGMSRAAFKAWIQGVIDSSADLAQRAIKDKLVK